MKQNCLIDTTVILRIIFEKDKHLLNRLLSNFNLFIPVNVLEEAAFKITVETLKENYGSEVFYKLKSIFERQELPETLTKRLHALNYFADLANVLPVTAEDYRLSKIFSLKYRLLSNDALIVAVAVRNGISKLATFDSDFKRVGIIEVLDFTHSKG